MVARGWAFEMIPRTTRPASTRISRAELNSEAVKGSRGWLGTSCGKVIK